MSTEFLDTGPLVAYLDGKEQHHEWAKKMFAVLHEPLLVCEAVLTEACFLLAGQPRAIAKIGDYLVP